MSFQRSGQIIQRWWQEFIAGRLRTPQDIWAAALQSPPVGAHSSDRFFGLPENLPDWNIPQRLAAPRYWLGSAYLRHGEKADWQSVDYRLQAWAALFVEIARRKDIPLFVHSAFRTKAEQDALVERGVSRARWPLSAHNIGEAVDIVHGEYAWSLTNDEWKLLGIIGREAERRINARLKAANRLILNWGGDEGPGDTFRWDPAHWEIADFRTRRREIVAADPVRLMPRKILRGLRL